MRVLRSGRGRVGLAAMLLPPWSIPAPSTSQRRVPVRVLWTHRVYRGFRIASNEVIPHLCDYRHGGAKANFGQTFLHPTCDHGFRGERVAHGVSSPRTHTGQ